MLIGSSMFRIFIVLSCIIFTLTKAQETESKKTTGIPTSDSDKVNKVVCQKCEKPKDEEEKTWCNKNCPNNFKQRSIVSITTEDYCVPCIREIIPIILTQCDSKCGFDIMRKLQKLLFVFASNPSFFEASSEMIYGAPAIPAATNVESVVEVLKTQGFFPPPPTNNHCGTIVLVNSYPAPEPIIETIAQPFYEPVPQPIPVPVPMPQNQYVSEFSYEQVQQPPSYYQFREDITSLQPFMNVALSIPEDGDKKDSMKEIKLRSYNKRPSSSPPSPAPTPIIALRSDMNLDGDLKNNMYKDNIQVKNNYMDDESNLYDKDGKVDDTKLQKYKKGLCKECINQQQLGNRKAKDCEAVCYWAIFSP